MFARVPRLATLLLAAALGLVGAGLVGAAPAPRALGVATPVEDAGHIGLARYYSALKAAAGGSGVARALHYGDSTIAADGISRTVRARLAARFGDAGPGFIPSAFDGRWNKRSDLEASRPGDWSLKTILFGGGNGRYGLGGIVGSARAGASVTFRMIDAAKAPVPQRHLELWYQAGAGYGTLWAKVDGREVTRVSATAPSTEDRRFVLDSPEPFTQVSFGASGGTVPFYGAVLETGKAGTTWESLGVIGVGSKSFTTFAKEHLGVQMAVRRPDLVVVMLGGNEAGYPILSVKGGAGYAPIFEAALHTIRAGAPTASCLVITPLDQGYRDEEGVAHARPGMPNLVAMQRQVAKANGCAFWSAYAAMGGAGSALRWSGLAGIGTGDLVHVTPRGLEILATLLADALLADYDAWASGR